MKTRILLSTLFIFNISKPDVQIKSTAQTSIGHITISETISNNLALYVFISATTALIVNNLSWHNIYNQKAKIFYQSLINFIDKHDVAIINNPRLKTVFRHADFDDIIQHLVWLDHSYNNWVTFWNWTTSQKKSLEQLQATLIITMYNDLMQLKYTVTDQADNEETLLTINNAFVTSLKRCFRQKFGIISIYPLSTAYDFMEQQHHFIIKNMNSFPTKIQTLLYQALVYLQDFQFLLRQDPDYLKELSDRRTHNLLINVAHAVRR